MLPFRSTGNVGPEGVAVDAAGNLYVVSGLEKVLKVPAG
jgi:uncharacterized protein YjiK